MEVILDTNFIISCIRKRIDFLEQLELLGFKVLVPKEVFEELKDLKKNGKISHLDRTAIDVAFELFEKKKVHKISLGGNNVDKGLIAKGREGIHIATLDKYIKHEIPNRVIISDSKNKVIVDES